MHRKLIVTISAAVVVAASVFVITVSLNAQVKTIFSQGNAGRIASVDINARTITVSYAQLLGAACKIDPLTNESTCPAAGSPNVLREGEVLAINALDQVENDFAKMKVDDIVTVYFKSDGASSSVPYAIKNYTLVPPGCDSSTRICGGAGSAGSGTGVVVLPKPATAPAPAITQDLSSGVQSDQVVTLQLKLQELGYFPDSTQATGYFGPITKKAVIDFQSAEGLPTTGFVGPLTRNALGQ